MKNYTMIFSLLLNCCFNWIWFHHTFLFTSCCLVDQLSVWETICDTLPHSSYQNFWFKIPLSAPTQVFHECWSGVPLPPGWKFGQIEGLWICVGLEYLPSPRKIKIWSGLDTLDLSWSWVHPPPPLKWKFGQGLALWIWVGLEYTPLPKWNLVRTWQFGFELVWSTPSPLDLCGSSCVETNCCISQGYRLVTLFDSEVESISSGTIAILGFSNPVVGFVRCVLNGLKAKIAVSLSQ